jgi:dolichol-phosphate mannosyltransferase
MTEISIIIPTYNEERSVQGTIRNVESEIKRSKMDAEIVVVDDSKDKTFEKLKAMQRTYRNIVVIHRENERGVGSAIIRGIEKSKGEFGIIHMSDAPDDVTYFKRIVDKLREGYDVVHASRFMGDSKIKNYNMKKMIGNRLCNNFCRIAFLRPDLKDFSHLFKGFRRSSVTRMKLEANDFDIGIEMSLRALKMGMKVGEVPVSWAEREIGESKWKMGSLAKKYFSRTLKIWLGR